MQSLPPGLRNVIFRLGNPKLNLSLPLASWEGGSSKRYRIWSRSYSPFEEDAESEKKQIRDLSTKSQTFQISHLSTSFWKNISSIHVPVPYLDIKQVASPTTHFFRTPFHNFTYYFQSWNNWENWVQMVGEKINEKFRLQIFVEILVIEPIIFHPNCFEAPGSIEKTSPFSKHTNPRGVQTWENFSNGWKIRWRKIWVKLQTMEPLNWPIQISKLPQDGFIFLRRMERWW